MTRSTIVLFSFITVVIIIIIFLQFYEVKIEKRSFYRLNDVIGPDRHAIARFQSNISSTHTIQQPILVSRLQSNISSSFTTQHPILAPKPIITSSTTAIIPPNNTSPSNTSFFIVNAIYEPPYVRIKEVFVLNTSQRHILDQDIALNHQIQGRLYEEVYFIGYYMNPAVMKFRDRYLFADAMTWGTYEVRKRGRGLLLFKWLNYTLASFTSNTSYLCVSSNDFLAPMTFMDTDNTSLSYTKEDPRMLIINDTHIHIIFTATIGRLLRMATMDIKFNLSNNCLQLHNFRFLMYSEHMQKNWSPFIANQSIYYVQSFNPFVVMNVDVNRTKFISRYRITAYTPQVVSRYPTLTNISWISKYGDIHGGSNIIQLPSGEYFGFFHSSKVSIYNIKTYYMGAYTFSNMIPYHMMKMSPVPIMLDENFYRGELHPKHSFFKIDYIIFPTAITLIDDSVYLSFGHQDMKGYIAKFNIDKLLSSLITLS